MRSLDGRGQFAKRLASSESWRRNRRTRGGKDTDLQAVGLPDVEPGQQDGAQQASAHADADVEHAVGQEEEVYGVSDLVEQECCC